MNPLWKCHNTPFDWETNNCALMAADYYKSITGIDYAEEFRGKFKTPMQAYRLLAKAGGMEGILTKHGFKQIEKTYAQVGDVALYRNGKHGLTMGIVSNGMKVVIAGGAIVPVESCASIYRK